MLVKRNGEFVSRIGEFAYVTPWGLEDKSIAAAIHHHAIDEIRSLDETANGTYQYSVSVGSAGIYFLFHLNDAYLLTICYHSIGVDSLDDVIDKVLLNFHSLLEVLYSEEDSQI